MYVRSGHHLDALASKLRRAQADYQRARAMGDTERVCHFQIQINALTAERELLKKRLAGIADEAAAA